MSIWDDLDKTVDLEGLQKDVGDAAAGSSDFKEVPVGEYVVEFEKLELAESKAKKPMVSIWMKILEGEYTGQRLFYNQSIAAGFGIHLACEFLRSLDTGMDINFTKYGEFALLLDRVKAITDDCDFAVKYYKNKKDYSVYEINEIFEK